MKYPDVMKTKPILLFISMMISCVFYTNNARAQQQWLLPAMVNTIQINVDTILGDPNHVSVSVEVPNPDGLALFFNLFWSNNYTNAYNGIGTDLVTQTMDPSETSFLACHEMPAGDGVVRYIGLRMWGFDSPYDVQPWLQTQDPGLLSYPDGYYDAPIVSYPEIATGMTAAHEMVQFVRPAGPGSFLVQSESSQNIMVYNSRGQGLRSIQLQPGDNIIALTDLPSGMIVLATNDGHRQKIIAQ